MQFEVTWAMPNKATFSIPPIKKFIDKWIPDKDVVIVDPFRGESDIGNLTNDIRETRIDSLVWLKSIPAGIADVVLFDPPYTPRQLKECYNSLGLSLHDTTAGYWARLRDEVVRISHKGTIVLSFGYGASHIGTKRGYDIEEGLIVLQTEKQGEFDIVDGLMILHGSLHNATICMAEVKR